MRRLLQVQHAQRRGRVDEHRHVFVAVRPLLHPGVLVREPQQLERVVGIPFNVFVRPGVLEPAGLMPLEVTPVAASQAWLEGI